MGHAIDLNPLRGIQNEFFSLKDDNRHKLSIRSFRYSQIRFAQIKFSPSTIDSFTQIPVCEAFSERPEECVQCNDFPVTLVLSTLASEVLIAFTSAQPHQYFGFV